MSALQWEQHWDAAFAEARESGKDVMAYFFNPDCVGCKELDYHTFGNEKVIEFLNARPLIPLKIPDSYPIAARYGVAWTPTIFVLDPDEHVHQNSIGFHSPQEIIPWIKLGQARQHFDAARWENAREELARLVADYKNSYQTPEAIYLHAVASFKLGDDASVLKKAHEKIKASFPKNVLVMRTEPYSKL